MPDKKYEDSRPVIPAEVARAVKVEAGHNCAIRHCPEHTYLEIHHINKDREDNRLENLILLCDKHHKMTHVGIIDNKSLHEYKNLLKSNDTETLLQRFEKLESMVAASRMIPPVEETSNKTINLVLEEAVLLGNKLWNTPKGNELGQQIFSLVRKHGAQMGIDSIDLMVRRSDSYSRTGLLGLSILYDEFFDYAKSLNLINYFEDEGLYEVAFYCALREHFADGDDFSACLRSPEFEWGGFKVGCDKGYVISKYPYRGASVVLDCLKSKDRGNDT